MTRQKKDATRLLEVWQEISEEGDVFQALLRHVVQQVLEEEITVFLGAESHERTEERRGYRNGYKPRTLKTRVGRLELMVPKDREGRFRTELFERYQRSEKALMLAIVQMYVQGVSTRKVKKITEMLCGLEISKSQVSALAQEIDAEIAAWRSRPLEQTYPYLVVDARYEKVRRTPQVVSQGVLTVVGVREDGYREILGTWIADSESEVSWSEVFKDLKSRGLRGVAYVVSDDNAGLVKAIEKSFQGAVWQRCQVHFVRNIMSRVKVQDKKEVITLLRTITRAPTYEQARENMNKAIDRLESRYPNVAQLLEDHGEEILGVYALPASHRKKMRSTNMLERHNQEIKRRTRVIRIFPNEASCLRLVSALSIETNQEWMERRYVTMPEGEMLLLARDALVA